MSDRKDLGKLEESMRDHYDTSNKSYFEARRQMQLRQKEFQERPNYFRRKLNRIAGGLGMTGKNFAMGFMQGSIIGAAIGIVSGIMVGIQTRRLSFFFVVTLTSTASFGFIMGIGSIVRSQPLSEKYYGPYPSGKEWIIRADANSI
eukprot:TRINITY_DN12759_c0_g1_i26.p1 TRINITY_DN12759_c0_g1~~TRINITY_DN12759_c0_g1_i26.p1  ORF type:complete len:146 (+),score=25.94 TRINITY_DN12759_c0_g1_i26:146-583(+)